MSRPLLEVADIVRHYGDAYLARYGAVTSTAQYRVLQAVAQCRTAVLGGHKAQCDHCGHEEMSYNSCRNRHCPKCQGRAQAAWLAARIGKLNGIFAPVFPGAHPRNPTAWTPQRLYVPLPAPAGQRAGEVWGASPGYPWGESRGTAGRRGGRMAPGHAQAHRHARGLCGAHVADRTTLAWA